MAVPMEWLTAVIEADPGFDAAYLPDPVPRGFGWCMVYAGGSAATHAWDAAELERVVAAGLRLLPVWVPTPGHDDPAAAGEEFAVWLADHGAPKGTPVLWDMETAGAASAAWLNRACDVTAVASGRGALNLVYGSTGTLFGLPARSGYFPADPTGSPHFVQRPEVAGTQYRWNVPTSAGSASIELAPSGPAGERMSLNTAGVIDLDVITRDWYKRLWKP
jgi:hypothetical protein